MSITDGGRQCKVWDIQGDITPQNYCRNYGERFPWCWVIDASRETVHQKCSERICGGKCKSQIIQELLFLSSFYCEFGQ